MFFSSFREMWAFTRFGGDLLSRGLSPSTIGAAVLNFRVRDGTGCFTCAMTTKPRKSPRRDFAFGKARRAAGSVFVYECALPHGYIINQHRGLALRRYPLSRSVYAFGFDLSFCYWIKSSLSGD